MKVNIVEPLGFCNGVKQTLNKINNLEPCYLLHSPIHNNEVLSSLLNKGFKIIEENDYYGLKNTTVITSAHGTNNKVREYAKQNNIHLIETTCTFINNINKIIENNQNKQIIILGNKEHVEIKNFIANYPNIIILPDLANFNFTDKNYLVITQSTYNLNKFEQINIQENNVEIINTICPFVIKRAKNINNLQKEFCIVVGDKTSSNANQLYQIALTKNSQSLFVENLTKLKTKDINAKEVTIISATSTSIDTINPIIEYLEQI